MSVNRKLAVASEMVGLKVVALRFPRVFKLMLPVVELLVLELELVVLLLELLVVEVELF